MEAVDSTVWLTARDIAKRYGISVRTAHRWIASGRTLRVLRIGPTGRTVRVHRDDLERFERERTYASAPTAAA